MKKVVIIGAGISGLTAAHVFANSKEYEVHIVERSEKIGGLLKSFDYGEFGHFDYGAHNILETGIKELDDFYLNLFPKDKWQTTTTVNGQIRALTGLMYNNKLQKHSPFIDLRENEKLGEYIGDFFLNLENRDKEFKDLYKQNAYSYSMYLFGEKITTDIILPAIKKLYGNEAKDLNTMVLFLTQFTRIGLFEEKIMEELVHLSSISSSLAYSDQLNLPEQYLTNLRSLYPKDYGIYRVIDKIEDKLKEQGIIFHLNSQVTKINKKNNCINEVYINDEKIEINQLVSSVSYQSIASLFDIPLNNYKYDKNPKTVITNILIDKKLNCDDLSFIYSYDKNTAVFRISNYINYCDNAKRKDCYPISIESLHFDEINKKDLEEKLIKELEDYNILQKNTKIKFIRTEILEYGFPLLTQNNVSIVNDLREKTNNLNISNLTNIGILAEEGLFFESHVIKDAYLKIKEII